MCLRPGIANDKLKVYGVQFHPEVDLTENGKQMMKNFLHDICKMKGNYTMKGRESACIQYIRDTVGNHKVLVSPIRLQIQSSMFSTQNTAMMHPKFHKENSILDLEDEDHWT